MRQVIKVLLYIYRQTDHGSEFFIQVHHDGFQNVLSGHVGDRAEIEHESLGDAAARETFEELGAKPIRVTNLNHVETIELKKWDKLSTEHAFLIEISNVDELYLEGNEKHIWVSLDQLEGSLTFPNHQRAVPAIKKHF